MTQSKTLITICGRGNSQGIKNKNLSLIDNKPLIAYSIECAQNFSECFKADIILSTDSEEIKTIAGQFGLLTEYLRPSELATNTAGKIGVLEDVLLFAEKKNGYRYDYLLDLDITSPLRTVEDLTHAFEILQKEKNAVNLFSVSKPGRNPYFNVVEKGEDGYYHTAKKGNFLTRQSAPEVYDLNASFYFYRRSFFDSGYNSAITDRSLVYLVPHLCFDIDEPIDLEIMKFLIEQKKLDFQL